MADHHFWTNVREDWAGFSSDVEFRHPFFGKEAVTIFLREEDHEEDEQPPSQKQLDEYAETYKSFLANVDAILYNLQTAAYRHYQQLYAHYFENSDKSGEAALGIDSVEKHNDYIKDILEIRILHDNVIKIAISYVVDPEHGLEFKLVDNKIVSIGGIAEAN